MRAIPLLSSFLAALATLALASPAQAAPQILALLQTPDALPFVCEDGSCQVELSTLCLQRHRDPPAPNTLYRVHRPADVRVVTAAGAVLPLADIAGAEVRSQRSYTMAEVRVPAAVGEGAALVVGDGASLVPVAVAGDPEPLTEAEIAHVTGSLRAAATRHLASRKAFRDHHAAATLSRLVNAMPAMGRVAQGTREWLWHDVVVPRAGQYDADGLQRGETIFRYCLNRVDMGRFFSLRRCLENRHDDLMLDVNTDVWNATRPGS